MNKSTFFLLSILTIAFYPIIYSQEDTTVQRLSVGFQVGLNASTVTGTSFQGINKVGLLSSICLSKKIKENINLDLNLSYSQKGTLKPPVPKNGDYTKYLMNLDYISSELYCRYQRKGIHYLGGLGMGVLIRAEETDENNQVIVGNGDFSKMEITGALGILFPLSDKFGIGVLGTHSLIPVRKHANGVTFRLNRGQYNQVVSFILKYTILS